MEGRKEKDMLTRKQFDILVELEKSRDGNLTQRELSSRTRMSVGSVNNTLTQLQEMGLADCGGLTFAGTDALEPYRVKRAVFIAAGFGSRLVPVSLNTPKPLVRVKGKRIIDTLLDAVVAAGIQDIVIVRGYLSEQFDQLLYKYPTIRFIENPAYNEANNISSAMCARYLLGGSYVFEADLLLSNPALITKYQYSSNYLGVPVEKTDDWCFMSKGGRITKLSIGGTDCHHMFGVSYWTEQDGARLAGHIKQVYEMPGGRERYWDQVALECFVKEYNVGIRECSFDDIVEIDTFNELKSIDSSYNI